MIKLLDVKSLGNSNYEIIVSHDGVRKNYTIVREEFFVEEMNDYFSYFNSENDDFYNVWGYSFDLRQEISKRIKQLKKAEVSELQAA